VVDGFEVLISICSTQAIGTSFRQREDRFGEAGFGSLKELGFED
jgi:hypothetical protein